MEEKSITGVATGQKTSVMRIPNHNVSILQGEQLGLIIALILSENSNLTHQYERGRLLTDHLNSVRLIEDHKSGVSQTARLRYMNGRSYYRWILTLAERFPLNIQYTPGYSNDDILETQMNNEAYFLASTLNCYNVTFPVITAILKRKYASLAVLTSNGAKLEFDETNITHAQKAA